MPNKTASHNHRSGGSSGAGLKHHQLCKLQGQTSSMVGTPPWGKGWECGRHLVGEFDVITVELSKASLGELKVVQLQGSESRSTAE